MNEDPEVVERRRRNDTIEIKLSDIRAQLNSSSERMDNIEVQLDELKATNAVIREHIEATCEVARAASVLITPLVWIATRIRMTIMWVSVTLASVLGIDAAAERFGWW